ncbi:putative agmatine deiminase [Clytia hemisphaerica]|uniref:Agmatine deiminase n=1 Tax=Clytia hemisphaerica TaxID=252671 RepID=A0A7M5VBV0_9CNID
MTEVAGTRMPAEYEPHLGVILHYPHIPAVWRGQNGDCRYARFAFREVARAISRHGKEDVHMFCNDEADAAKLRIDIKEKGEVQGIFIHVAPSNDSWARDTGPTFAFKVDQTSSAGKPILKGVDWDFNAYGGPDSGAYWPCEEDKVLATKMVEKLAPQYGDQVDMGVMERKQLVMEGGSFHADGEDTILTTEECLLNKNRNPEMTKHEIETILKETLGASKVIWMTKGLYKDLDTNGHVDNIACFVKPGHVLLAWSNDISDPQYDISRQCEAELLAQKDAQGRSLTVHKILCPQPPLFYTQEEVDTLTPMEGYVGRDVGERMAASYVNFYIANDAIILPGFDRPETDRQAREVIQGLFPDKKVVQLYTREIILGGGNIHCITQQIPSPAIETTK